MCLMERNIFQSVFPSEKHIALEDLEQALKRSQLRNIRIARFSSNSK